MRWNDLPAETQQRAHEQLAKLLQAAAQRALLSEELEGGVDDE